MQALRFIGRLSTEEQLPALPQAVWQYKYCLCYALKVFLSVSCNFSFLGLITSCSEALQHFDITLLYITLQ